MNYQVKPKRNHFLLFCIAGGFITLLILLTIRLYIIPGELEQLDQAFIDAERINLEYIYEARRHCQAEILLTGDSVGRQCFYMISQESPLLLNISENAYTTMAGYYIYCHEFLKNRTGSAEHPLDVVIMASVQGLYSGFESPKSLAYNYLPWAVSGNLPLLDEETNQCLYEMFGLLRFRSIPFTKIFANSVFRRSYLLYCQYKGVTKSGERLTDIWLPKIDSLCREHNARLHLLASPMPDVYGNQNRFQENCLRLQTGCDSQELKFSQRYKDSLLILPDSYFRDDKLHLRDEYLERTALRRILSQIPQDSAIKRCLELTANYNSKPTEH